jgi:hypothetical protein
MHTFSRYPWAFVTYDFYSELKPYLSFWGYCGIIPIIFDDVFPAWARSSGTCALWQLWSIKNTFSIGFFSTRVRSNTGLAKFNVPIGSQQDLFTAVLIEIWKNIYYIHDQCATIASTTALYIYSLLSTPTPPHPRSHKPLLKKGNSPFNNLVIVNSVFYKILIQILDIRLWLKCGKGVHKSLKLTAKPRTKPRLSVTGTYVVNNMTTQTRKKFFESFIWHG